MKFTLDWLRDHLETTAGLQTITEALTIIGHEVDSVHNPGDSLADFTICRVIETRTHPDADALQVCRLATRSNGVEGRQEEVEVVCGAPNARAGLVGVFAPPGSWIPGTGMMLKQATIRGVTSSGMLCSERELMISDEHDGIIELPDDAPLGMPYAEWSGLNDPIIDIDVTPNRPDALGVRGIARDLAAHGIGTLKTLPNPAIEGTFDCPVAVSIRADKNGGCPLFLGRLIRGVTNQPSPTWMQRRLEAIGLRPISALVDITNYVTYDRNRPLHVFDADKLKGPLHIHHAAGNETLTALDGQDYEFDAATMAISDESGPVSLAGLIGGERTGCSDTTVNVFVESALWDPVMIARSGRRLKINSDARYRFERGVDPEFTQGGLDLASTMILGICGGEPSRVATDGTLPRTARTYTLRTDRVARLVGMKIAPTRQVRILEDLGFAPRQKDDVITVTTPSWRPDIHGEADLVEEVARIASLAKLKGRAMKRRHRGVVSSILTPAQIRERALRRSIASLGYNECVTYSFTETPLAESFLADTAPVALDNPISSELDVMRPDLLPGLLLAAARNQKRGAQSLALFEVGPVFTGHNPGDQVLQATGLRIGPAAPRSPHESMRLVDIYDVKADLERVLATISPTIIWKTASATPAGWHPARTGCLFFQPGKPVAMFGQISPKVLRKTRIGGIAVAFTICMDRIPFPRKRSIARPALAVNDLQGVVRDFAFVVEETFPAGDITAAARRSTYRGLIESIMIFDEFTGKDAVRQFGEGYKSVAFSVRLQPKVKAFTDAELSRISDDIIATVTKQTGASLRAESAP